MLSFPCRHWAHPPKRGCRLPDAILHGKRSYRPRSRAAQCLASTEFQVRLFSPLRLMVAPPACGPGQDTPAIGHRVLTTWLSVSHCFWQCVRRSHGSRLFTFKLPWDHSPAVSFLTSPAFGSFSRNLPSSVVFPMRPLFLSAFRRFSWGGSPKGIRQSHSHRADTQ
jgi:hypothetical protein